jgi:hypothetical protein
MLLELQKRDFQKSEIRHSSIKAIIDKGDGNVNSSSEDLIQVSTKFMGDGVWFHCICETKEMQLTIHTGDVIVKVILHHDSRVHILLDDILDDTSYPTCSLLLELPLSRFKIAVEYLSFVPPCCQSCLAEICS